MQGTGVGLTGGVGSLLAAQLLSRGDGVSGLVRTPEQALALTEIGGDAHLGNIAVMDPASLSSILTGADAVVFSAGSNGGPQR